MEFQKQKRELHVSNTVHAIFPYGILSFILSLQANTGTLSSNWPRQYSSKLRVMGFSHRCIWGYRFSGTWGCVIG